MKRVISLFLVLSMLFLLSSCAPSKSSSVAPTTTKATPIATIIPSGTGQISLTFSSTDSLNPYMAVTNSNRQLGSLLYDSLIKLDSNYKPQMALAEKIRMNGNICVITLKDAVFSDGSAVGAEDVTYSLKAARSSALYKAQLADINFISASSQSVVSLGTDKKDVNFVNLLDFPIFKMNTDIRKSTDQKALPPIGSGRYIYVEVSGKYYLKPNARYRGDKVVNSIELIHTPDEEALAHIIAIGGTDMFYSDLSDLKLPKLSGKQIALPLTNLVYIGINSSRKYLNNAYIRTALASAFNREYICQNSYYTYATPAVSPFPSSFVANEKLIQKIAVNKNSANVIENLSKAGYNKKDGMGFSLNSKNEKITLSLLYNTNNAFRADAATEIATSMQKEGINVVLVGKKFADYSSAITSGNYDLYIGEMKLNKNFDLTPLLGGSIIKLPQPPTTTTATTTTKVGDSTTATTAKANEVVAVPVNELLVAFQKYKESTGSLASFLNVYYKDMPFIPVCYRSGVFLYSTKIKNTPEVSMSDIYLNIDKLTK